MPPAFFKGIMKYKALRSIYTGDPGHHVKPGEIFDVPEHQVRSMERLEAKGIIERYIERPRLDRKAYTVYANKAITPATTKQRA